LRLTCKELRGFVCKNKLNGLAQYFHYCYFEELATNKKEIETKILEFFNGHVLGKVPHTSYVIDFCILNNGKPKIIEINPFHFSTGAPFFGWKKGSEGRKVLLYGPFEFRIRDQLPEPEIKNNYLVPAWEKFINKELGRTEQIKETEQEKPGDESWCSTM